MNWNIPVSGVKTYVQNLALANHVAYTKTQGDAWAETVTRLAGDDVVTDEVEDLIVALKRAHVIDAETMVTLLGNYLDERNISDDAKANRLGWLAGMDANKAFAK